MFGLEYNKQYKYGIISIGIEGLEVANKLMTIFDDSSNHLFISDDSTLNKFTKSKNVVEFSKLNDISTFIKENEVLYIITKIEKNKTISLLERIYDIIEKEKKICFISNMSSSPNSIEKKFDNCFIINFNDYEYKKVFILNRTLINLFSYTNLIDINIDDFLDLFNKLENIEIFHSEQFGGYAVLNSYKELEEKLITNKKKFKNTILISIMSKENEQLHQSELSVESFKNEFGIMPLFAAQVFEKLPEHSGETLIITIN